MLMSVLVASPGLTLLDSLFVTFSVGLSSVEMLVSLLTVFSDVEDGGEISVGLF